MVAAALGSFLMLLMASMWSGDTKMHSRVKVAESLQTYEISQIKTFSNPGNFDRGFLAGRNPQLDSCRSNPCQDTCTKVLQWQPMEWQDVPITLYKISGKPVNDGGRYTLPHFNRCLPLPLLPGETQGESPPRYDPACRVSMHAEWKSGPYGTLQYRIVVRDQIHTMNLVLNHQESPYRSGTPHDCRIQRSAAFCKSPGAYLLSVDFDADKLTCASPFSEVNYQ